MRLFLLLILAGSIAACSSSHKKSDEELQQLFADYILQAHPKLKIGNQVLFIVSKTECSPCRNALEQAINTKYKAFETTMIVFDNQSLNSAEQVSRIQGNAREIARYGLLTGDGAVAIFKNGEMTFFLPIDVEDPDKLISAIKQKL